MLPRRERHRIMEDFEKQLSSIGVSPNAIEDAKKDWHRFNMMDLARPVFNSMRNKIQSKISDLDKAIAKIPQPISASDTEFRALVDKKQTFGQELMKHDEWHKIADFQDFHRVLERWLEESACLAPEDRAEVRREFHEVIEDMKHYAKNHRFRRLDHWLSQE
jgi:hypothetical protein